MAENNNLSLNVSFLSIIIEKFYRVRGNSSLPVCLLEQEELVVVGEDALKVADALTAASFKVLQLLSKERLDVSMIAERLGFSEAYISEQVRLLEDLKLIKVSYERGKRGIRKMCQLAVKKITIIIAP